MLRPSTSSSPQAQQTCRFLVLLLLRPLLSLSPAPCVRYTPQRPSTSLFNILLALSPLLSYFIPLSSGVISGKNERENTTASTHVYPEPFRWQERSAAAAEQQECGCSFSVLGRLMYSISAVKATEKNSKKKKKKNPYPPLSPITAKTCSTSLKGKTKTTSRLSSHQLSVFLFFSWIFPTLRHGPTPAGFPTPARQMVPREGWLSDTATLTELYHVTAL